MLPLAIPIPAMNSWPCPAHRTILPPLCRHVPLGATMMSDPVIIELPPMVRRRLRAGSAAADGSPEDAGMGCGAARSWEESSAV
jgi:hypothetical protein